MVRHLDWILKAASWMIYSQSWDRFWTLSCCFDVSWSEVRGTEGIEKRERGGLRTVLSTPYPAGLHSVGCWPLQNSTAQAVMPTSFSSIWQWEALMGGWRVRGWGCQHISVLLIVFPRSSCLQLYLPLLYCHSTCGSPSLFALSIQCSALLCSGNTVISSAPYNPKGASSFLLGS